MFKTKALMLLALSSPVQASLTKAPEIELTNVKGSIQDFERTVPDLSGAYYSLAPRDRNDGLKVGDISHRSELVELAKDIAAGKLGAYDSILITHQNKLVFESYYNKGRVNLPHYQASASKAYTTFAIGRAIQMGYLSMQDLHRPVLDFLEQVDRKQLTPGIEKITLHHTLSMRSGLRISVEKQRELLKKPALLKGQKLAQAYFTHSAPVNYDTQTYKYQSIDTRISMLVLDAMVPDGAKAFIQTELLDKLGIENYYWEDSVSGIPESAFGTSMTSRDMLKWSTLLKQNGHWQRQRLIPSEFLTLATGSHALPNSETFDFSDFRYGYYFWGTKIKVGDKQYDARMAWGGGGQFAMALDELDLAIAITANVGMQQDQTFAVLKQRILPIFVEENDQIFRFPELSGPYMGQTPPGNIAEPFAPGIISGRGWQVQGTFAPGMQEFYFTTDNGLDTPITVVGFRQQNNVWKKYTQFRRDGEITFSPDGQRMYMAKGYKDRNGDSWTTRKSLGPLFDRQEYGIMRLSASANGSYVFDDYKSNDVIRISSVKDGIRQPPKKLSPAINSGKWTAHPFIAPDESYLIWDSEREGGYGKSDLYISFRQKDGTWGPAINMGDRVNSEKGDTYASVTPDGKYILFNREIEHESDDIDIYWVDASIIEELRPKL